MNSQSYAVQRKRPCDLLYFCKRFRLHVGKTPIDDPDQYGKVKLSSFGACHHILSFSAVTLLK